MLSNLDKTGSWYLLFLWKIIIECYL